MIYTVRHVTQYDYATPVDLGTHMLHLQPRTLSWQRVLRTGLLCDPAPAAMRHATDCFGNAVSWLFLDTAHPRLVVTLEATVEVQPPASLTAAAPTPGWETVSRAAAEGGQAAYEAAEFLFDSPMAPALAAAGEYARASFPAGRPVLEALTDLNTRIGRDFAFRSGATTVHTTVAQVLAQRAGVCQDFSHVMIAGLRSLGLPARYVSGYIQTRPPPGQPRQRGCDQSHAWVACWLGAEHGWMHVDPTNGVLVRDEHVVLGWGRDFADVSPLCGVILGGGKHSLKVSVDLEPERPESGS